MKKSLSSGCSISLPLGYPRKLETTAHHFNRHIPGKYALLHITSPGILWMYINCSISLPLAYPNKLQTTVCHFNRHIPGKYALQIYHFTWDTLDEHKLQHITSPWISQETVDHSMSLQQTYPGQVHTVTYHFTWDTLGEHKLHHITSLGLSKEIADHSTSLQQTYPSQTQL